MLGCQWCYRESTECDDCINNGDGDCIDRSLLEKSDCPAPVEARPLENNITEKSLAHEVPMENDPLNDQHDDSKFENQTSIYLHQIVKCRADRKKKCFRNWTLKMTTPRCLPSVSGVCV